MAATAAVPFQKDAKTLVKRSPQGAGGGGGGGGAGGGGGGGGRRRRSPQGALEDILTAVIDEVLEPELNFAALVFSSFQFEAKGNKKNWSDVDT